MNNEDQKVERDINTLNRSKRAQMLLEELEDELTARERSVKESVFQELQLGEKLDPQYAVQKWLELWSIHRIRTGLTAKVQAGNAASKRLGNSLTRDT